MATVKRITDLKPYATVLPYASELFGIYQPLLGWKSRRIQARVRAGFRNERRLALENLMRQFPGFGEDPYRTTVSSTSRSHPATCGPGASRVDSVVLQRLSDTLSPPRVRTDVDPSGHGSITQIKPRPDSRRPSSRKPIRRPLRLRRSAGAERRSAP